MATRFYESNPAEAKFIFQVNNRTEFMEVLEEIARASDKPYNTQEELMQEFRKAHDNYSALKERVMQGIASIDQTIIAGCKKGVELIASKSIQEENMKLFGDGKMSREEFYKQAPQITENYFNNKIQPIATKVINQINIYSNNINLKKKVE